MLPVSLVHRRLDSGYPSMEVNSASAELYSQSESHSVVLLSLPSQEEFVLYPPCRIWIPAPVLGCHIEMSCIYFLIEFGYLVESGYLLSCSVMHRTPTMLPNMGSFLPI